MTLARREQRLPKTLKIDSREWGRSQLWTSLGDPWCKAGHYGIQLRLLPGSVKYNLLRFEVLPHRFVLGRSSVSRGRDTPVLELFIKDSSH